MSILCLAYDGSQVEIIYEEKRNTMSMTKVCLPLMKKYAFYGIILVVKGVPEHEQNVYQIL